MGSTSVSNRLPILLWGDLVRGRKPILRRALAGARAHECMYAWVYLTEFLAIDRLRAALVDLPVSSRRRLFPGLEGNLWSILARATIDPYYQLSRASFDSVAYMTTLAQAIRADAPQFVELGSTFFASKLRFEIIDQVGRELFSDWKAMTPEWVGIDISTFMHDTTRLLHRDSEIKLVRNCSDVPNTGQFSTLISRFVASYVFPTGVEFAKYAANRFQAIMIEDAYSTIKTDVSVSNHGQRQTFFSMLDVFRAFADRRYNIFVLDSYPDYPAGSAPCHVVKYLALSDELSKSSYKTYLAELGFESPQVAARPDTLLDELNSEISAERWAVVKRAKSESPIWGRTPELPERSIGETVKSGLSYFSNVIGGRGEWGDYQMGGPQAINEIARAIAEERP